MTTLKFLALVATAALLCSSARGDDFSLETLVRPSLSVAWEAVSIILHGFKRMAKCVNKCGTATLLHNACRFFDDFI
jgi:hypothetical protein